MKIKYLSISLVLILYFVCLSACSASSATTSSTNTASTDENGLPQWSEELEYQIKLAYFRYRSPHKNDTEFNIADVSMDYYGSYGGYEAVLNTGIGSAMYRKIEVGGHTFGFGTTNVILMYKDGTFTEFQNVFQEGKLTQEDADRLYDVYERIIASHMPVE